MSANRVRMPEWLALVDWGGKIATLFGEDPYLVGSAGRGVRDYHDVDVRVLLDDDTFEHWFGRLKGPYYHAPRWRFLMAAISAWGRQETGLPIDFQVQRNCLAQVQERAGRCTPIVALFVQDEMTEDEWHESAVKARADLDAIFDKERAERESGALSGEETP